MAITVQTRCSDCGSIVEQTISSRDPEVRCPECARNVANLPPEEFKDIERSQSSQNLMGMLAVFLVLVAIVLCLMWIGFTPKNWVSTDNKAIVREDTTLFLAGAGICVLVAAVLGALGSRTRYVIDF